jgi:dipeptidyl aminopeptidase/acylaminoacyl peptidase
MLHSSAQTEPRPAYTTRWPASAIPGFATAAAALSIAIGTIPRAEAQSAGRPLAIEDYYRIKSVGSPELSPDAQWVAFTVSNRLEDSPTASKSEVWLVPMNGSAAAQRISAESMNASGISWAADGRLRFTAGGRAFLVDPARPTQLDSSSVAQSGAAAGSGRGGRGGGGGGGGAGGGMVSPDGKMVAAVRNIPVARRERVFASDFEKRHEDRFKGVQFDWLNFQRDGGQFPVANRVDPEINPPQEIFVTPTGGVERQLTHLGLRPAGANWNADGTTLVFTADSSYRNERLYGRSDIWTVSTSGVVKKLTSGPEWDYAGARYSPDGKWILASRGYTDDYIIARKLNHGGPTDLVVIPAAGGAPRVLTEPWDYLPSAPMWSPDGKYVYFTGGIGGTTHLFRVSPDGGPVQQMTKGERRISGLAFDKGMTKMTYLVGRFEAPSEIYSSNIDGTNEKQLTRILDPFMAEVALSKSERLQFKSKDGTMVEGWLMFPHNYRPNGGPYPMVVSSHGGPHSATGYGFDFKLQYFAANGYFVLQTNFRSSTGYGEKFLWGTWGAWGDRDGEDVIAGMDHVISRYPINAQKVATIGHSYGGFMSNWLITQYPDRFAAACVGAGIVNWVSDYGTADIARTKETEFFGTPWETRGREIMIRQSPLTYAHRVKAATLFIHGEVDQRVPYTEAEQMFVALKKIGVPAKIIQYAGMPHGISGSYNVVHRMLNERKWMDLYLK